MKKYIYKVGMILCLSSFIVNSFWIKDLRLFFFSGYLTLHCLMCHYYPDDKITHFFKVGFQIVLLFLAFVGLVARYPGLIDTF
jgi:hypothetical protein